MPSHARASVPPGNERCASFDSRHDKNISLLVSHPFKKHRNAQFFLISIPLFLLLLLCDSFIYVAGEAVAVVIAGFSFSAAVAAADAGGESMGSASMSTLSVFMLAVVVSRVGLYGFDVGVLELQQRQVDEKDRNAVGAVENSMTSAGTLLIMALSMDTTTPESFVHIVWASAVSVCFAAVLFGMYLRLWHEHEHSHPLGTEDSHAHTTQQRRMLVESTGSKHVHMHFAVGTMTHRLTQ